MSEVGSPVEPDLGPFLKIRSMRLEEPAVWRLVVRLLADERVRFVVVGGFNTVIGYGLYAIFFELVFGHPLSRVVGVYVASVLCVYASYVVTVPLAFALHRRFTFRVHGTGRIIVDFPRFCIVYVISLTINTFALPAIEHLGIVPLLAQAMVLVGVTVVTYFGHRIFSFHRPDRIDEVDSSDTARGESGAGDRRLSRDDESLLAQDAAGERNAKVQRDEP